MNLFERIDSVRGKHLIIGGHRGHQSEIRENTIANFEELQGEDIPYLEIDVQMTKDGYAVAYHDPQLDSNTKLTGMVRDYTLDELRHHFAINTIDEVLNWCKQKNMGIALELKLQPFAMWEDRIPVVNALVDLITKYEFFEMCFVFGKDYDMLSRIKQAEPRIKIALIVPFTPKDAPALMREMDAVIYLNWIDQLSKPLVDELHEAGYLVDGSVVNSETELDKALALGVDMIESDYPVKIKALYERKKQPSIDNKRI